MEPNLAKIAEWQRLLEIAQNHSKTNPLGDGKCDPSNAAWRAWQDQRRELERNVYNANPYRR